MIVGPILSSQIGRKTTAYPHRKPGTSKHLTRSPPLPPPHRGYTTCYGPGFEEEEEPLCDSGYFEIFNRENIDIVDLRETSIHQVVPEGIQMIDGTIHKLDVLILATGFDAVEGNYLRASINGREDKSIQKHWENGAKAYGGIACSGFPNMFLAAGPQGAFANFPPVIEMEIELIMNCILHAKQGQRIMEVTPAAEQKWNDICKEAVEETLFRETDSWFFGTNVKGRSWHPKLYFGGIKKYLDWSRKEIDTGFPGFNIDNRSKI